MPWIRVTRFAPLFFALWLIIILSCSSPAEDDSEGTPKSSSAAASEAAGDSITPEQQLPNFNEEEVLSLTRAQVSGKPPMPSEEGHWWVSTVCTDAKYKEAVMAWIVRCDYSIQDLDASAPGGFSETGSGFYEFLFDDLSGEVKRGAQ